MLKPAADARSAAWLSQSAGEFGTVHSMIPDVFEAYARVFHPASLGEREVRWSDVASANRRTMHGAAEWGQLTGSWNLDEQAGLWDREPRQGETPEPLSLRLATVLSDHTGTPECCWFGVWEGWGVAEPFVLTKEGMPAEERERALAAVDECRLRIEAWDSVVRGAPSFEMPSRKMHVLVGPLTAIGRFYEPDANPPSIWWPDDRAWCVGGDVDLLTTYVGGSAAAIAAVVGDDQLEALAIPAGQDVTWEADTVNPRVGPPRS